MEFIVPKYRRNPNEKVYSLYSGIASGNKTVTRMVKKSRDGDYMEATQTSAPMLPRGEGGQIAILVLGGLETTLDEIEYILEARKQKPFRPRRGGKEIADMCRILLERRNDLIRYLRKNPSEAPKKKRSVRLHLPVGYHFAETPTPGLKILAHM